MIDSLPRKKALLEWHASVQDEMPAIRKFNAHIHSPYSFSAFESIGQTFQLAKSESISVLGINDFIVTDGYDEFSEHALRFKIYPIFCIEFMGLLAEEQSQGIRINDPNNPGRIYFSGKGLAYPVNPGKKVNDTLKFVKNESNRQTAVMIFKLDQHLKKIKAPFRLSFQEVKKTFAMDLVRERHIAKAIRAKVFEYYDTDKERKEFFTLLFGGKHVKSGLNHYADLENEIRSNLLKSGGEAFVPEDPKAFLSLDEIIEIILKMGGIPTYPVLLDDPAGNFTAYEGDFEKLHQELSKRNISSIELIPTRNNAEVLKKFVAFFHEKSYIITFGTEHNTPELTPLSLSCRKNDALDEQILSIGYEGVCLLAAHQYLISKEEEGLLDVSGKFKAEARNEFVKIGRAVIDRFVQP
ncbi:MAG: hypothetical protein JJU28_14360 [Cyclobacteriaceae bacterium]|nr:hypothetical protein [Cyclobacteriaceae bacterium]